MVAVENDAPVVPRYTEAAVPLVLPPLAALRAEVLAGLSRDVQHTGSDGLARVLPLRSVRSM